MGFLRDFWIAAAIALLVTILTLLWFRDPGPLPSTKAPGEPPEPPLTEFQTAPSRTLSLPICYALQRSVVLEVTLKDQQTPVRLEPYGYGLTDEGRVELRGMARLGGNIFNRMLDSSSTWSSFYQDDIEAVRMLSTEYFTPEIDLEKKAEEGIIAPFCVAPDPMEER